MRDVDPLFQKLRDGMLPRVTGPEPAKIISRARARTARRRLAAGALAASVAVSLVAFQNRQESPSPPPVLTSPSATATASVQARPLKPKDLLYAAEAAEGDRLRWYTSTDLDGGPLYIQVCGGGTEEESDPLGTEIPGTAQRLLVTYNGNAEMGNEMTSTSRGEQVIVFTDEETAIETMNEIVTGAQDCAPGAVLGYPEIGDDAISSSWTEPGSAEPQRGNGVAARQGRAIVVYGDIRNNGRPLATLTDHERDTWKTIEKLKSLGY